MGGVKKMISEFMTALKQIHRENKELAAKNTKGMLALQFMGGLATMGMLGMVGLNIIRYIVLAPAATPLGMLVGTCLTALPLLGVAVAASMTVGIGSIFIQSKSQPDAVPISAPKKDCSSCAEKLVYGKKNEFNDEACPPSGPAAAAKPQLTVLGKRL